MGFGFEASGHGKGGFDESIIIWILVILLLLGDDGCGGFGKGGFGKGDDFSILIIIIVLLLFSGGGGCFGFGTEATE